MTWYLLDTNILLRVADRTSVQHSLASGVIAKLFNQGDQCVITAQVLIEFWVVATRPVEVNGLGWTPELTAEVLVQFMDQFRMLEENERIFQQWFQWVTQYKVKGKRTHDLRLMAFMDVYQISYLLTFNPNDFIRVPQMTIVTPEDVLGN
ncbi:MULTISPECIES: type II toxin-antitoxin system VapC family toxin [Roseofilum]|uniref:Twitching motility protein PilT n=1 Tax=Roseofilum reptotaenium AO1-A TaxID=1925591 RepID=A0A1L9QVB5_9CYAN|nr:MULTISPECIES: PIN domain-containing protein [Roseofilum]OJJ26589.1 twitching motility protein PilT [Roseofilum reptotaenium AO1-A]HBQ97972.1 PIN domain nuclease [Cyanobacteria bacterium UBA11691]MBP0007176.1 PIN domain-containing protein [Roseofilum sp. Belize Diploria]MBP0031819.1 PIN domain-containing protein [Roseofilum sp. Belize BBD 4]MDB9518802.1 PIN domain-containing protein [Roseofilum reptotaenium CS-1145]